MAIRYTVTTSSCPHCGHVLKREGYPIGTLLLLICTAFLALLWYIAIPILNKIFDYDGVKMGSPYIRCPNCNKIVKTNEAFEWASYNRRAKKNWAFRNWMRFAYAMGGLALFSLLMVIGSAISGKPSDVPPLIAFLIVLVVMVLGIVGIYFRRKKLNEDDYITVSSGDYDLIKESWQRHLKFEPNAFETETIKISDTGRIIKPQKRETVIKSENNTNQIDNKKELDAKQTAKQDETSHIIASFTYDNKPKEEKKEIKKPTTKHVIVAKKKKNGE